MARENDVRLWGAVADNPRIIKDAETGAYTRGAFHLVTVKSDRPVGDEDIDNKDYDWPLIVTNDPEKIKLIAGLKPNDIVEVYGAFTTQRVAKRTYCRVCGAENVVEGFLPFVVPIYLIKRNNQDLSEREALINVRENRPISNHIHVYGNLCTEVTYYHKGKIETSTYQIAIKRRYYVKGDESGTKTDFPLVRTYGPMARLDSKCIHTGTKILIDGYLHTRSIERTSTCTSSACGKEFKWPDDVMEIIPFSGGTEYMQNYTDPAEVIRQEKEEAERKNQEKAESIKSKFMGHANVVTKVNVENLKNDTEGKGEEKDEDDLMEQYFSEYDAEENTDDEEEKAQ